MADIRRKFLYIIYVKEVASFTDVENNATDSQYSHPRTTPSHYQYMALLVMSADGSWRVGGGGGCCRSVTVYVGECTINCSYY